MTALLDVGAERGSVPLRFCNLRPGAIVKLLFEMPTPEAMWVIVTEADAGRYAGTLDSHPVSDVLAAGDRVTFEARHVIDVAE